MTASFPSGFLIVDKPSGVTSFSMVSLVRRITGVRRVGHAGTLDPLASGVLPVAIGQATRFIEYMDDALKTYVAGIRFGVETDTYDDEGEVTASADASDLTLDAVTAALVTFTGDIQQAPPAYSALKRDGRPLYSYARKGIAVEVAPRSVHVERIQVLAFSPGANPKAQIEVVCGKGTYIRSFAHDLGRALGCGAHLTALRRTSSGGFDVRSARLPDDLVAMGAIEGAMLAIDRAVERRRAAILAEDHGSDVLAGRNFELNLVPERGPMATGEICRAYDATGSFLGVLRRLESGGWHPAKVLRVP